MSIENEPTNPPYISRVHLKGYKSIIDTSVDLHPGLNIIIGPNGSGKTNFLQFLKKSFSYNEFTSSRIYTSLEIVGKNERKIWERKINSDLESQKAGRNEKSLLEWVYSKDEERPEPNKLVYFLDNFRRPIDFHARSKIYSLQFMWPTLIKFSLPENMMGLSSLLTLVVDKENLQTSRSVSEYSRLEFTDTFITDNFLSKHLKPYLAKKDKSKLLSELKIDFKTKNNLKRFSQIQDVKVGEGLVIKENNSSYTIDYIIFEFLVDESWITWNMLSDGMKRLFYLISEITLVKGICLIEEPELGLYPEQLDLVLQFLKEQSKEKQILLTTHAPRTLDILKNKELDRIIITKYDKEKGTLMRHLSEEQIQHIINYKDTEGYTSDLWEMTDFFEEETEMI